MEIKNLAQLKRVIQEKREFIIRVHRQEKFLGQKRIPNVVQSNGFYSVISGQPEHEGSFANYGKGSWIDFGKATQWEFQEETCSMYLPEMEHIPENLIWTIEFCKDKTNIPQKLSTSLGKTHWQMTRGPRRNRHRESTELALQLLDILG